MTTLIMILGGIWMTTALLMVIGLAVAAAAHRKLPRHTPEPGTWTPLTAENANKPTGTAFFFAC